MQYNINEIFYSIQGEGQRCGTANIFIRFSGCNLTCNINTHGFDCDTEFVSSKKFSLNEIYDQCIILSNECRWLLLTGGEPLLQVNQEFIDFFKSRGYKLAIETNGTIECPDGIDWICVSPKVAEHCIRIKKANEVKYVRGFGQQLPKTKIETDYYYISPAFNGNFVSVDTLNWCIELVKRNPVWRLSVQQHKLWKIQ